MWKITNYFLVKNSQKFLHSFQTFLHSFQRFKNAKPDISFVKCFIVGVEKQKDERNKYYL